MILDPGLDLTLRPMRYPQFFCMYKDAIKNTWGVVYDDEYVRRGTTWLIAKRVSHFTWQVRDEIPAPPAP